MASRIEADLIVVGAPRGNEKSSEDLGDTIGGLVCHSDIPLIILPRHAGRTAGQGPIRRLVLPLTQGCHHHGIFAIVSSFACEYEASVILVPVDGMSGPDGAELAWELIRHEGVEGSIVRRPGPPARAILAAAASEGADVICVPSFHCGRRLQQPPDSLAEEMIKWSPIPVLVIPGNALEVAQGS
jgi:nucleotide-binding universal stress UspA family protein